MGGVASDDLRPSIGGPEVPMPSTLGAVKKAGMKARGTGQFSISLEDGTHELLLDDFYARLCDDPSTESAVMEDVVTAARRLCGQS